MKRGRPPTADLDTVQPKSVGLTKRMWLWIERSKKPHQKQSEFLRELIYREMEGTEKMADGTYRCKYRDEGCKFEVEFDPTSPISVDEAERLMQEHWDTVHGACWNCGEHVEEQGDLCENCKPLFQKED